MSNFDPKLLITSLTRHRSADDSSITDSKEKEKEKDKPSSGFLRFGSAGHKSKNARPSTADGPDKLNTSSNADLRQRSVSNIESLSPTLSRPRDGDSLSPKKDHPRLRKRTSSYPGPAPTASPTSVGSPSTPTRENTGEDLLQPGQSVLKQIGECDHSGWMLKRGDRYNSWKSRYFVLKGQHLYCLRSSSTTVSYHPHLLLVIF